MRPRTVVDLLEPELEEDRYTEEPLPNWQSEPTEHIGVPATVEPISSTEQVLTSGTVVSRWTLFLDPDVHVDDATSADLPAAIAAMTTHWRVRWRGKDYDVEGAIEDWEGRAGVQYRRCVLKRVDG